MLENILYINKISEKKECLETINKIDALLNTQRRLLRIMCKNKWIDNKKFNIVMEQIYEIADYCYSNLRKNNFTFVEVYLNCNYEIIIHNIR